jgi:NitT/TauT family transport system substrate-binding protein
MITERLVLGMVVAAMLAAFAATAAAEKVNVGLVRSSASAPLYIAREKNFFAEEDIEVNLVHLIVPQAVAPAVASGDVRLGVTALSADVFTMAARGALKMIAGGSEERPKFRGLALVANRSAYEGGLTSPADLPGKRIAITAVGSANHNQLTRLARKYSFRHEDMQLVALETVANEMSAVKRGQVDAAPLPAALAKELEDSGAARIIAWMGDEIPMQVAGLFATPDTIAKRHGLTARFVRAYVKALHYYHQAFQRRDANGKPIRGDNYDEAMRIVSQHTGEPPAALATTLPYFDLEGTIATDDLAEQIAIYKALRVADARLDVNAVIDRSFVPVQPTR